ncbi:MAG: hypothetical protein IKX36_04515 [Prevotella sp.]|nr:hypothetical protein [Prevotella sp.]
MKRKTFLVALAALPFLLAACGDKPANQSQSADNQEKAAVEEKSETSKAKKADADKNVADDDPDALLIGQIDAIRSVWASKPLKGVAAGKTIDIERFAYAFCKEYPNFDANKAIYDYIVSPATYKEKNSYFRVESQKKYGYLSCRAELQVSWDTYCCYWKRNNGHCLVAFWMEQGHESEPHATDGLLVFYDYNPATDTMTPETSLAKKVEEAMSPFDEFSVNLPAQGKDIELTGYKIDIENDSAEGTDYLLRWNGYDFKMEKVKE